MSNHYHSGICDVTGCVPAFLRDFHGLLARCINAARGRWENLWASEQAGMLELVDAEAVFDKMIYGLTNPCAANLVDKVSHWPGVSSFANVLTGKAITARRPHWFFDRGLPRDSKRFMCITRIMRFSPMHAPEGDNRTTAPLVHCCEPQMRREFIVP